MLKVGRKRGHFVMKWNGSRWYGTERTKFKEPWLMLTRKSLWSYVFDDEYAKDVKHDSDKTNI